MGLGTLVLPHTLAFSPSDMLCPHYSGSTECLYLVVCSPYSSTAELSL